MIYRLAADALVLLHLAFVLFVLFGALAVARWPRLLPVHLAALAWGAWVELAGRICPLTPLENTLRRLAGEQGYAGSFVEHYLLPIVYPPGLTRDGQIALGVGVLTLNLLLYLLLLRRRRRRPTPCQRG